MKNASVAIGSLSLICFIALSTLFFSCNEKGSSKSSSVVTSSAPLPAGASKLAYVNIDSFEASYLPMKERQEDFKKRQLQMDNELQRSYQQMQNDAAEVQKKAQANTLTQAEYETAQKRLMQMQQSFETRKQSMTDQLMKERDDFNKELKAQLDAFFEEYNKTRHYDFIYYYSPSASSILYANKQLDITQDVIDGMNAQAKNTPAKKK
ncbi:MAG: OmpH family outer membrane protein [Bacteroidota bacterium]